MLVTKEIVSKLTVWNSVSCCSPIVNSFLLETDNICPWGPSRGIGILFKIQINAEFVIWINCSFKDRNVFSDDLFSAFRVVVLAILNCQNRCWDAIFQAMMVLGVKPEFRLVIIGPDEDWLIVESETCDTDTVRDWRDEIKEIVFEIDLININTVFKVAWIRFHSSDNFTIMSDIETGRRWIEVHDILVCAFFNGTCRGYVYILTFNWITWLKWRAIALVKVTRDINISGPEVIFMQYFGFDVLNLKSLYWPLATPNRRSL